MNQITQLQQIDPTTVRITFDEIPRLSTVQASLDEAFTAPLEMLTSNTTVDFTRLFSNLVWYFRVNGGPISAIQLRRPNNGYQAKLDGWLTREPDDLAIDRYLGRQVSGARNALQTAVMANTTINYDITASGLFRIIEDLDEGRTYKVEIQGRLTSPDAQLATYQVTVTNSALPTNIDRGETNTNDTIEVVNLGNFTMSHDLSVAEFVGYFAPGDTSTRLDISPAGQVAFVPDPTRPVEAFELLNVRVSEVLIAEYIADMAQDGTLAGYLDQICNSVGATWFANADGQIVIVDLGGTYVRFLTPQLPTDGPAGTGVYFVRGRGNVAPSAFFSDTIGDGCIYYQTNPDVGESNDGIVNDLTITNHQTDQRKLSTDAWTDTSSTMRIIRQDSIDRYGRISGTLDVSVSQPPAVQLFEQSDGIPRRYYVDGTPVKYDDNGAPIWKQGGYWYIAKGKLWPDKGDLVNTSSPLAKVTDTSVTTEYPYIAETLELVQHPVNGVDPDTLLSPVFDTNLGLPNYFINGTRPDEEKATATETLDGTKSSEGSSYIASPLWDELANRLDLLVAGDSKGGYRRINSITVNMQEDPDAIAALDQFDRVYVKYQGLIQDSRIVGIQENGSDGRTATVTFALQQIQMLDLDTDEMAATGETWREFSARFKGMNFQRADNSLAGKTFESLDSELT